MAADKGQGEQGNLTWATKAVVDKYLASGQFAEAVATVQHVLNSGRQLSPHVLTHLLQHLVRSAKSKSPEQHTSLVSVSTAAVRVVQSFRAANLPPNLAGWHALLEVFGHFGMPPVTAPWTSKQARSSTDSWLPRKVSVVRQRRVAGDRSAAGAPGQDDTAWAQSSTVGLKHVKAGQWEAHGGMLIPRDEHSLAVGPRALLQGLAPALLELRASPPPSSAEGPLSATAGTLGGVLDSKDDLSDEQATAALLAQPASTGGDPFGFGAAFAEAAAASSPQQQYGASALPQLPVTATPDDYSPSEYPPSSSFAPSSGQQRPPRGSRASRAQATAYTTPHHVNDALGFLAATWEAMGSKRNAKSVALLLRSLNTVPSCGAAAAAFVLDLAEADNVPLNTEVQCAIADVAPCFTPLQGVLALLERCVQSCGAVSSSADGLPADLDAPPAAALGVQWGVQPKVFGSLILRLLRQQQYMAAAEALDAALEVGVVPPPKAIRGVVAVLPALSRLQIIAPNRKQELTPVLLALRREAALAVCSSQEAHVAIREAESSLAAAASHSTGTSSGARPAPDAVMGSVQPTDASWGSVPHFEQEPPLSAALLSDGQVDLSAVGLASRAEAAAVEADAHTEPAHVLEAMRVLLQQAAGDTGAQCAGDNHLRFVLDELRAPGSPLPRPALLSAVFRSLAAAGDADAARELLLEAVRAFAACDTPPSPPVLGAAVACIAEAGEVHTAAEIAEQLLAGELPGQRGEGTVPPAALRRVMMCVDDVRDLPAALKAFACIVAQGGVHDAADERALQEMCLALIRSNKPVPPSMVKGSGDLRRYSGYFNAPPALGEQLAELQAAVQPAKAAAPAQAQSYQQLHEVDMDRAQALSAAFDAAKLTCSAIIQWLLATAAGVPPCPVKDLSRGWEDLNALESSLEAQLAVAQSGVVEDGDVGASAELRSVLAATLELLPLVVADCPSSASAHAKRLDMSKGRHLRAKTLALRREQLAWTAAQRQRSGRSQYALASSVAAGEKPLALPRVLSAPGAPAAAQAAAGFQLSQPRVGVWLPDAAFEIMSHGAKDAATEITAPAGAAEPDVPVGGTRRAWHVSSGRADPKKGGAPHVAMLDGTRVPLSRARAIASRTTAKTKAAQQAEDAEDKASWLDEHDAARFAEWDSRGHAAASGKARRAGPAPGAQNDELQALLDACKHLSESRA